MFSSLATVLDLSDTHVLDLYAGSGALGLEALSRGAGSVTLVDRSAPAVTVMRQNVAAVGLPGARVIKAGVADYLRGVPRAADLVLIDPPYDLGADALRSVLEGLAAGWLVPGTVVVVERGTRGQTVDWPVGFDDAWNRRFGDTALSRAVWYGHEQDPSQPPIPDRKE